MRLKYNSHRVCPSRSRGFLRIGLQASLHPARAMQASHEAVDWQERATRDGGAHGNGMPIRTHQQLRACLVGGVLSSLLLWLSGSLAQDAPTNGGGSADAAFERASRGCVRSPAGFELAAARAYWCSVHPFDAD